MTIKSQIPAFWSQVSGLHALKYFNIFVNIDIGQLNILQFNSILILSDVSIRLHRYESSVPQDYLHFRCQSQVSGPEVILISVRLGY